MIDFHCHLDLYSDPSAIIAKCARHNIGVLSVTNTPSAWRGTAALAEGVPLVRTALGLHPRLASSRKHELSLFEKYIDATSYVGEIGLDGEWDSHSQWADQMAVFVRILTICEQRGGRVMSIHSRRAATAVLDSLEANPESGVGVLHWFSGTHAELDRAVRLGCWFSVGPAMLGGAKGRSLIARMPLDRILLETDGPFVNVKREPAAPWNLIDLPASLARVWNKSVDTVNAQLARNYATINNETRRFR